MSSNLFSENFITSSQDPQKKIGPFNGKVASHIATNPDLHYICTTPNQDPYITFYSHLGAIPRKPNNSTHPLSIMWWDPTPSDFVASTGGILLGMGSLATTTLNVFQAMEQQLQARLVTYRENTNRKPPKHALDLIAIIATALSNALIRLSSLKTLYTQMRFTVTEFQCYYLELVGLLDYMEIYQPRM
ncbi:hypothetical protein BJ165DRAFT_1531206 [Panaeolus papilionaceus]|nr:hypothetical protein BJ165DRAFT_1531206 [Panaeolus papilionaceus]